MNANEREWGMARSMAVGAMAIVMLAAAAPAAADEAMAKAKGCTACHDVKKKIVGPAYADVAKKYKGAADGQATMVGSILKGSQGKWGPIPMPPNKVTDDEAKKLAAWILTL
jgi:cytochrome c